MKIHSHRQLDFYQLAFEASMEIFELTKSFPQEEKYSLIDQIRRSSRSVCANIAEAFHKRKYPKYFISKLSDAEAEAAETQTWLDFSKSCKYLVEKQISELDHKYDKIIGKLVNMSRTADKWGF